MACTAYADVLRPHTFRAAARVQMAVFLSAEKLTFTACVPTIPSMDAMRERSTDYRIGSCDIESLRCKKPDAAAALPHIFSRSRYVAADRLCTCPPISVALCPVARILAMSSYDPTTVDIFYQL